jgi:predicted enzyme related to lactoylglutathione lyase
MDLLTSDTDRASEFYTRLFGWTAGEPAQQFGGYFMFLREGVPVAGCMGKAAGVPSMEGPDTWGIYLSSPDAKATTEAALERGAQLREGPMDIADLGTDAVLTDPDGARIGLWQARQFPGITVFGEPGTPYYFELLTRDYAGSTAFYRDVFGWTEQAGAQVAGDSDEFRLTVLNDAAGTPLAGIMDASAFLPADVDPFWGVYLKVADTDATLARIAELGGTVTDPAWDTPYGRMAAANDPTGARFKVIS